jgi:two-component system, chemotaxis family, response regulator Rcp1
MDRIPRILLVEDNPADVDLAQEAFRECGMRAHFYIVGDGQEAWDLLTRCGPYAGVARPDFIILDLNLPRMSGRELLARIKADAELRPLPVIVLTTSSRRQDIDACYDLLANSYIVKPATWDAFLAAIRSLEQYWFHTAELPSPG